VRPLTLGYRLQAQNQDDGDRLPVVLAAIFSGVSTAGTTVPIIRVFLNKMDTLSPNSSLRATTVIPVDRPRAPRGNL
jgi:hypothetical protein